MKRRALLTGAVLASALWTGAARAQVAIYFNTSGDTAHVAVPGSETRIQVRGRNPYWYGSYFSGYPFITYVRATFVYDATKIQLLGVEGASLSDVSVTPGPGTLTVNATGNDAGGPDTVLYLLRVKLLPGVTDGTYLWIKGDSADVYNSHSHSGFRTQALGAIGQVCHATQMWGDVDRSGDVDSRDALITLSAAVGLPNTGGFNLALGDVDGDGLTNSRDALLMLSYAVAIDVGTARVGDGILDACPGLTAPGDTVAFLRNDAPAGLYALGASSTVPAAIPNATNVASDPAVRLAADGRSVVYECPASGGVQICRADADTGGVVQLTADAGYTNTDPDWSPAGDSVVFIRSGFVAKMTNTGAGLTQLSQTASDVKWSRDGTRFAYTSTADGGLHIVGTDGSGDTPVTTGFPDLRAVRWSPDGNSLVLVRQSDPRLWVVPVSGGTPSVLTAFAGSVTGGDWGAAGIILSINFGSGAPSLWVIRGVNGPIFRVTRPTTFDDSPSWRRSP